MKKFQLFSSLLVLVLMVTTLVSPAAAQASTPTSAHPQTFTVLVGSENSRLGVSIMSFFPRKVRVHVGDTVLWKANSFEIHTVTFLAGAPMPEFIIPAPSGQPSPLMINPMAGFPAVPDQGLYDGTTYVNSGIMSKEAGQIQTFSLTFTAEGTFEYVCIVHGMMMSGEIDVVSSSAKVLEPWMVQMQARREISQAWEKVPGVLKKAMKEIQRPVHNPDGTTTYTVKVGYSSGEIDIMRFFPRRLNVKPGDTVIWDLSTSNVAPHTVTFLNGTADPGLVLPVPQPNGPPLLLFNPAVLFPSQNVISGLPLTDQGLFNSGLMNPAPVGPTSFSLKIGDVSGNLPYLCLLHDTSGMKGVLHVISK